MGDIVLSGEHVRLEPLGLHHVDGLHEAIQLDPELYRWSPVPKTIEEAKIYVERAMSWREAGTAVPFATVRQSDGRVIGSTRFFDLATWDWPISHERHGRTAPDVGEIGYTWLSKEAVRTGANTEAKLLMLTHAFETWQVFRICFHTDARNERSKAALERIGCQFEGLLHRHRMAADFIPRDSLRFSIVAEEWPDAKQRLLDLLARHSIK